MTRRVINMEQRRLQQLQEQAEQNPLARDRVRRETAALLPTELEQGRKAAALRYRNIQRNFGRRIY